MRVGQDISKKIQVIDAQIVELREQGYMVEVDRLLEKRQELQLDLEQCMMILLARS